MKHILPWSALWLTASLSYAQNTALDQFVDTHKQDLKFTFAYMTRDLFEVVSNTKVQDKDWKKLHQVVKNVGSLRLLATDENPESKTLYQDALRAVPTDEFDELLTVRDGNDNVRVWTKDDQDRLTDLVLLVGTPDEFVLVLFSGELELGDLSKLAELFDSKSVEQLANTSKLVSVEFTVGPNPSNGDFTLHYNADTDAPQYLMVADAQGRQLKTLRLSGQPTESIKIGDLPDGLYWIQMKTTKGNIGLKQIQILR